MFVLIFDDISTLIFLELDGISVFRIVGMSTLTCLESEYMFA